jgi:hypothetical protein
VLATRQDRPSAAIYIGTIACNEGFCHLQEQPLWDESRDLSIGLAMYLNFGSASPNPGSERFYLEHICRRPRVFATCVFMAYAVLLGFSTSKCIRLGVCRSPDWPQLESMEAVRRSPRRHYHA